MMLLFEEIFFFNAEKLQMMLLFEEMNFQSEIFILVQKIKCMPICDLELPSQCNTEPNNTTFSTKYMKWDVCF